MRHEVGAAQLLLEASMKRNIKGAFRQHTGDFVRSITSEPIAESGNEISGRTGSNLEYAEIQEKGGTIHAKNVRFLTIPLEAFMTGQGVARGTARDVIAHPEEFGYDGTFFSKGVLFGKEAPTLCSFFCTESIGETSGAAVGQRRPTKSGRNSKLRCARRSRRCYDSADFQSRRSDAAQRRYRIAADSQ